MAAHSREAGSASLRGQVSENFLPLTLSCLRRVRQHFSLLEVSKRTFLCTLRSCTTPPSAVFGTFRACLRQLLQRQNLGLLETLYELAKLRSLPCVADSSRRKWPLLAYFSGPL